MNNDFRRAEDLDSSKNYFVPAGNIDGKDNGKGYFKQASDLESSMDGFRRAEDLDSPKNYFVPAGNIDGKDSGEGYFKQASDLESSMDGFRRAEDLSLHTGIKTVGDSDRSVVENYLLSVVSGKRYDAVCELGTLCGGGKTIVSFSQLKEMVESGYNIVSANYINQDMIDVEFQQFRKNMIEGRGR